MDNLQFRENGPKMHTLALEEFNALNPNRNNRRGNSEKKFVYLREVREGWRVQKGSKPHLILRFPAKFQKGTRSKPSERRGSEKEAQKWAISG